MPEELPFKLKTERVKKIEKIQYDGYLYNLTTESGNLFANKILVKNSGGLGTPAHERVVAGMLQKANSVPAGIIVSITGKKI